MTKRPHRPAWRPGDPCRACGLPIATEGDKYKPHNNICRPCGRAAKQAERDANRAKLATPCTGCGALMLDGNDRKRGSCAKCRAALKCACEAPLTRFDLRYGNCLECRKKAKLAEAEARRCKCGRGIGGSRRYAKMCSRCAAKARSESATRGNATMREKLGNNRPMATHAVQVPMDTGEYRPPLTRAEALAQERMNDDPARSAWIDAVCARRVGAQR
jgi:hypothetical protein